MKLNDIIKKKSDIETDCHQIDNDMIRGTDISVISHFGNVVSLNVYTDCCCIIHDYNNTKNLGLIIHALTELLDLTAEDGYSFNKIKDVPIRIISDGCFTKVLGFGHFMKDRFVYTEDLMKITEVGRL